MKLYTELEIRKAIKADNWTHSENEILSKLTPIELPSDEDIEDKGKWVFNNDGHTIFTHYNTVPSWVNGAKWMREQILNQNEITIKETKRSIEGIGLNNQNK